MLPFVRTAATRAYQSLFYKKKKSNNKRLFTPHSLSLWNTKKTETPRQKKKFTPLPTSRMLLLICVLAACASAQETGCIGCPCTQPNLSCDNAGVCISARCHEVKSAPPTSASNSTTADASASATSTSVELSTTVVTSVPETTTSTSNNQSDATIPTSNAFSLSRSFVSLACLCCMLVCLCE